MRVVLAIIGLAAVLSGCAGMPLGPIRDNRLDPNNKGPQFHAAP